MIEDGFYYDIAYPRPFTPEDLAAIEQRMRELIDLDYEVIKRVLPRARRRSACSASAARPTSCA